MKSNEIDDIENKKNVDDMSIVALDERYCTIQESIIESFNEVKLMQEGKLPKKSWKDFMDNKEESEGNDMEAVLNDRSGYRRLDMSKLKNRKIGTMSSEESLKDIVPFNWSEDVLNGKKKVIISRQK